MIGRYAEEMAMVPRWLDCRRAIRRLAPPSRELTGRGIVARGGAEGSWKHLLGIDERNRCRPQGKERHPPRSIARGAKSMQMLGPRGERLSKLVNNP